MSRLEFLQAEIAKKVKGFDNKLLLEKILYLVAPGKFGSFLFQNVYCVLCNS